MKKISLFFATSVILTGCSPKGEAVNENVYRYRVGKTEVFLLSEGQQTGKSGILIGATPEMMAEYIPDGTFPNATNAFLVKSDEFNILIDAGYGKLLFNNLATCGLSPQDIDMVVLTHMHGDHIGGLLRDGEAAFPNAWLLIPGKECNYWTNSKVMEVSPENRRGSFQAAMKVVEAYGSKVKKFPHVELGEEEGTAISNEVSVFSAFGHTPGHSAVMVESDGEKLLIWGDLAHAMAIQMPYPDVAVTYDSDPEQAVRSRKYILEYVVENNVPIAGMHIAYPAIGTIKNNTKGGYTFTPDNAK